MLQYNTNSWHYKLVLYVYGKWFFSDKYIDYSMLKTDDDINRAMSSPDTFAQPKPKQVNFCPYCRAVAASIFLLPFSIIYKQIPKRKPKKRTWAEKKKIMERNSKILRVVLGSFNIGLGLKNIFLDSDMLAAGIFQISLGLFLMFMLQVAALIRKIAPPITRVYNTINEFLISVKILRVKIKIKEPKTPDTKPPNIIKAFFLENHNKYCPPIFFVNKNDLEVNK